jgi:hypothetical protein
VFGNNTCQWLRIEAGVHRGRKVFRGLPEGKLYPTNVTMF